MKMKNMYIVFLGILFVLDFGVSSQIRVKKESGIDGIFKKILQEIEGTSSSTAGVLNADNGTQIDTSTTNRTLNSSSLATNSSTSVNTVANSTSNTSNIVNTIANSTSDTSNIVNTIANSTSHTSNIVNTIANSTSDTSDTVNTTRTKSTGLFPSSDRIISTTPTQPTFTSIQSTQWTWFPSEQKTTTQTSSDLYTKQGDKVSQNQTEKLNEVNKLRCDANEILSHYCSNLPGALSGINFWDIYFTMFSDRVLEALLSNCGSGHWCLKDNFDFYESLVIEKTDMIMKSEVFTEVCEIGPKQCLDSIRNMTINCLTHPRVNFTIEAINLICKLKQDKTLTSSCFEELLISLHVTVVGILRDQNQKEDIYSGFVDETCKTPEAQMAGTFVCLQKRCQNHTADLANFRNWKWFTSDVETLKNECDFISNACISKSSVIDNSGLDAVEEKPGKYKIGLAWTEPVEAKTMIGITVGTFLSVVALTVVAFYCWRGRQKIKAAKNGYSPLRNDEP